ncbi:hypothetical protein J6590_047995 [Homalodisca vitripennis]|nr:hypothetical protein J6590_047995 [Homalodisca vitripennis]
MKNKAEYLPRERRVHVIMDSSARVALSPPLRPSHTPAERTKERALSYRGTGCAIWNWVREREREM